MTIRRARGGFTLVDLLTLIAIVGAILALLLPAIERDRHVAQRDLCMNKMKQIGLALLNAHDVVKKFPPTSYQGNQQGVASVWWPSPGTGANTGAIPSVGYTSGAGAPSATAGYSWIVRILPYMDEAPLFNSISQASGKFRADAFTPYNVEGSDGGVNTELPFSVTYTSGDVTKSKHFAAVQLDEVMCPAYAGRFTVTPSPYSGKPAANPPITYGFPLGRGDLGSPAEFAAISNYVALAATHFSCMQYGLLNKLAAKTEIPDGANGPNGMIVPGTGLNMRTCTDGAAKTLMICETVEPAMNCWYDGTTAWTTGINPNSLKTHAPTKTDPAPSGVENPEHFWNVPTGGSTALNVGPDPDKSIAYSPALAGYCATPEVISWGPSSNHTGGVVIHVAVDGSVHPIVVDIDPTVYTRLITRAGGEPHAILDVD